jgi:opacity protein-like surface antigen
MKFMHTVVLGVVLVAIAGIASAATSEIGIKGGVAMQKLGGDPLEDFEIENRTGFVGGAYFHRDLSKNFGLQVEALYYMKGAAADSADIDATLKLDYVEFPVLLVGQIPISETARLNLFGGPTFSFNTKSEVEVSVGGFSGTFDIDDGIKSFDFGLAFGAGLSFDLGGAILGFDGRYGFGLSSVFDEDELADEGITVGDDDEIKNQGFAFMASIGVPLGSE